MTATHKPDKKTSVEDTISELKTRLDEAEATLAAIRSGKVDALVGENNQIFTLKGADFSYRILVESMSQGAVTFSSDGTILYCNSFFGQMVKMPLEHLIGSDIKKFVKAAAQKSFEDLVKNKSNHQEHEFQLIASDQSTIPVYLAVEQLELGIPKSVIGMIVTDLTETKRNQEIAAAEKLAVQRLVHEHESAQKAKELEFVMKQRRALMASNRAKDEFISIASHQLRTPATSVKQYLGMLLEGYAGEIPDSLKLFLETAYNSNEQQLSIIDELLKIARIDSGVFKLKKNPVDIGSLVRQAIAQYQPIVKLRKQHLDLTLCEEVKANVDANEMSLAISNLIENASKYSPAGTHIKVLIKRQRGSVEIHIQDQGVGIGQEDIHKIFDKFTRVDNALSDTVSGTGLGLYWVKRIVKLHKGSINVKSELNKGSTFIVSIPI